MTEQDKAREAARLLMAWAEKPSVTDAPFCWGVKPKPRRKWETGSASIGGDCYSTTWSADEAADWRSRGYTVTEWQEVLS